MFKNSPPDWITDPAQPVEVEIERTEVAADSDFIISAMDKMFANTQPIDNRAKMAEFRKMRQN